MNKLHDLFVKSLGSSTAVMSDQSGFQPLPVQQQQGLPSADLIKAKWQQQLGIAKTTWGELTHDELLASEGEVQKLSGLVQERYALSKEAAEDQVNNFLKNCKP